MLVFCDGMPRSASTWTYNVVLALLRTVSPHEHVYGRYDDNVASFLNTVPAHAQHAVLKCHALDRIGIALAGLRAAKFVYSRRPAADAIASLMEMFGFDFERALAAIRTSLDVYHFHLQSTNVVIVDYGEIIESPAEAVSKIAEYLGIPTSTGKLNEIAASYSMAEVRKKVAELEAVGDRSRLIEIENSAYDPETLLHLRHIRDGRSGLGRHKLTEAQLKQVEELLTQYPLEESDASFRNHLGNAGNPKVNSQLGIQQEFNRITEMSPDDYNPILAEALRRQNPYLVRDNSPHPVEIKTYWLALGQVKDHLAFDDIGMSVFSQNNEDGIILYLFSRIGITSRKCIEIGCNIDNTTIGLPEGNSINLIVNFGFHGLIIDLEAENIAHLRHFFLSCLATKHFHQAADVDNSRVSGTLYSPVLSTGKVTPANINEFATKHGFEGEVDLLSIDIDSEDVKLLEAIAVFSPRVLIIEVNSRLPLEERTYRGTHPKLKSPSTAAERQSGGASLAEVIAVANGRGFVFVGMNNNLINAFFVRKDVFSGSRLAEANLSQYASHRQRPPESFSLISEAGPREF